MSLKDLKIKTGVVKRIHKELLSYTKEEQSQQARIDKMISEGKDEYDVKKQREVLDETIQMIPDCKRRLNVSYNELKELVDMVGVCTHSLLAARFHGLAWYCTAFQDGYSFQITMHHMEKKDPQSSESEELKAAKTLLEEVAGAL